MTRARLMVSLGVGAGLTLLGLANAHLVYVAIATQPECVQHVKLGAGHAQYGLFSAAKSAC